MTTQAHDQLTADIYQRVRTAVEKSDGSFKGSMPSIDAAIAWMRNAAIREELRMIKSISSTKLELSGCPFYMEKSEFGEIVLKGDFDFTPEFESFNGKYTSLYEVTMRQFAAGLVNCANHGTFYRLKAALVEKLSKDLDPALTAKKLTRLRLTIHGDMRRPKDKLDRVPMSLRLLNNLPLKSEATVLAKPMWDHGFLDKEIYRMCVRLFGLRFNLADYNWVARHKETIFRCAKENPAMVRLLLLPVADDRHECPLVKSRIAHDGKLPHGYGPSEEYHAYERAVIYARTPVNAGLNAYQAAKAVLKSRGLTDAGWKWLCKQKPSFFIEVNLSAEACRVISELAMRQVGILPRIKRLGEAISEAERNKQVPLLAIFLKAIVAKEIPATSYQRWQLVFDYVFRSADRPSMEKTTWASLWRKQERWHRDIFQAQMAARANGFEYQEWNPLVGHIEEGKYSAHELINTTELIEEGTVMQHCVGGYGPSCVRGHSYIFSIRKDGVRLSTLELSLYQGTLRIRQNYGVRNTACGLAERRIAKIVLAQANKVLRERNMKLRKAA